MERTFIINPLTQEQQAQLANRDATRAQVQLGDWGHELLPLLPTLSGPVRLVMEFFNVEELNLPENATWTQIRYSTLGRELTFIPLSTVLPLRFAYADQPADEFIRLAHDDLLFGGRAYRFSLYNTGRTLYALGREAGGPRAIWPRSCRFGFMRSFIN